MSETKWTFEESEIIKQKPNKKALIVLIVVASLLLAVTVSLSIYCIQLNDTVQKKTEEITNLTNRISYKDKEIQDHKNTAIQYKNSYYDLLDKYDFYYKYAACVDEKSNYYHKYDCSNFDSSSFWIYNEPTAQNYGYKPCPKCWN